MLLQTQSEEEFHNCQDIFLSLAPQFLLGEKKNPPCFMYCSARSSPPFEEEKAGQRKIPRDHHLAGYIKLSQH
jgi:hypothetical protein